MTTEPAAEIERDEEAHSSLDAAAWLDDHGDALYRYARARVGSRELAEDLVQETFLAAIQAKDHFQRRATERTWLFSILRHKIVDHYRRPAGGRDAEEPPEVLDRLFAADGHWNQAPSPWKAPDQALLDAEFWAVLDGCVGDLPRPLAEAFVLRELEDVEMEPLREVLNLSAGNLRVRLHRARLLLRDCLEKRWFGQPSERPERTR